MTTVPRFVPCALHQGQHLRSGPDLIAYVYDGVTFKLVVSDAAVEPLTETWRRACVEGDEPGLTLAQLLARIFGGVVKARGIPKPGGKDGAHVKPGSPWPRLVFVLVRCACCESGGEAHVRLLAELAPTAVQH